MCVCVCVFCTMQVIVRFVVRRENGFWKTEQNQLYTEIRSHQFFDSLWDHCSLIENKSLKQKIFQCDVCSCVVVNNCFIEQYTQINKNKRFNGWYWLSSTEVISSLIRLSVVCELFQIINVCVNKRWKWQLNWTLYMMW